MNEEAYKIFLDALAKAQAELPIVGMDAVNPHYKSKYAAYEDLVKTVMPVLTRHGLSIRHSIRIENDREIYVLTMAHKDGHAEESVYPIKPTKPGIQEIGSQLTYLKRYMLMAMTGVACSADPDDDDGEKDREDNETGEVIDKEQFDQLIGELKKLGEQQSPDKANEVLKQIKGYNKVEKLENLLQSQFNGALNAIKSKMK